MNTEQLIEAAAESRRKKLQQIIDAAADRAAKKTVSELRRQGLLRSDSYYKRTETLLRMYGKNNVNGEQAAAVERALAEISGETYAAAVQLYYFEGKTNTEVAEMIHTSERTAARGRQRLVQKLSAKLGKL